MEKLGVLKQESIRKIWRLEPEFSAWLALPENMELLGKAVELNILPEETEASVGKYSADILAREDGTDHKIIIENQYGISNHDHLGKLITYAAGKEAQILIWIVEKADDEHRAAVAWLNEHTETEIGIFLVQIEIHRINDSAPAVQFSVLERPNNWAKQNRQVVLTQTNKTRLEFWNDFMSYAMKKPEFSRLFNRVKVQGKNWLTLPLGSSACRIALTAKTSARIGAEVFIGNNKELFRNLEAQKEAIEKELGFPMDWQFLPPKNGSRIEITSPGDFTNVNKWDESFKWLVEKAVALREVFPKYLPGRASRN